MQAGQDVQSEILNNKSLNTDPENDNANRRTSFESNAILSTSENDEQDTNQEKEEDNNKTYNEALKDFESVANKCIESTKIYNLELKNAANKDDQNALKTAWKQNTVEPYHAALEKFMTIAKKTGHEEDANRVRQDVRTRAHESKEVKAEENPESEKSLEKEMPKKEDLSSEGDGSEEKSNEEIGNTEKK